jgi:hypothetical protein
MREAQNSSLHSNTGLRCANGERPLVCLVSFIAGGCVPPAGLIREVRMIRKLKSGQYRLYSRKIDPRTGRRRNLGTFGSRAAAEKHERAVQFFKRH